MQILQANTTAQCFSAREELPVVPQALWLIVSGVVKTYTMNDDGLLTTLGFWGVRDVIGKPLSVVEPYLLQCITDVEVIPVPKHKWNDISTAILNHGRQTQKMMCIVRSSRVYMRLWHLLQWLGHKFGRAAEEGTLIDFKITHQELADAIGTTRITVTKMLNQLEQDSLILRPRNKCIILTVNR